MTYVYSACAVHVTIFSTGGKFHPVNSAWFQILLELHTLTLAARSYMLLLSCIYIEIFVGIIYFVQAQKSLPHKFLSSFNFRNSQ